MTEEEKCMAGELYDCHDAAFISRKARATAWMQRYNALPYDDRAGRYAMLRDPRCRKGDREIAEELTGNWRDEHVFTLSQAYHAIVFFDQMTASFDAKIRRMYAELAGTPDGVPPPDGRNVSDAEATETLAKIAGFDMTTIDGIQCTTASAILSELGNDLTMFPSERHFVSFVGLAPSLAKSAGKSIRTRVKHKNTHPVGIMLKNCSATLWRSESALGALYRSVRSRSCASFATTATARQMAKYIYRGMRYGQAYLDIGEEQYEERRRQRTVKSMKNKIEKLNITPQELGFMLKAG